MKLGRWVLVAFLAAILGWSSPSRATVVDAISLGELLDYSDGVVVATVLSADSHYVDIGGIKRIVTDTVLQLDYVLAGTSFDESGSGSTIQVRTLGGTVGKFTQLVPGEAVLSRGSTNVLFLHQSTDGVLRVAAMAQGHYVVRADEHGQLRLTASPGLDVVVNVSKSVVTTLQGRTVEQAQSLITNVKRVP
jgi:hypothetical protein